jgi:hypothetical protein
LIVIVARRPDTSYSTDISHPLDRPDPRHQPDR